MRCLLAVLTLPLLLVAAPARAQQTLAPPGNAGVEQYLETVPGASGNQTTKPNGNRALPQRVSRQLESRGSEGQKLEALVDATAPRPARRGSKQPSVAAPKTSDRLAPQTAQRDDSRLDSFKRSLTEGSGSAGMGILLPLVLAASTLLLGVAALLRHRRRAG